ncbi:MAG: RNA-binding S4 domain-containing protein [Opitutae bacterium]|nr:RNA-binding S4 domain-containing protein [Opitutae bacterium]
MRVDKWLWAVRIFKTRSLSSTSCKSGTVKIGDRRAKPSSEVKPGDVLHVKKDGVHRTLKAIALLGKRVGAKLVADYMEDLTPQEEWDRVKQARQESTRGQGFGRPTKRDRREMNKFFG